MKHKSIIYLREIIGPKSLNHKVKQLFISSKKKKKKKGSNFVIKK